MLLSARLNAGGNWSDVRITDVASRGVGLEAAMPPLPGQAVEIRRGQQVISGRTVWSKGTRFGVQTRRTIAMFSLINEPDSDGSQPSAAEPSPKSRLQRLRRTLTGR